MIKNIIMKTMTPSFVTTQVFNKAMKKIDDKFESVYKRFESMDRKIETLKTELTQEIRRVDEKSDERFGVFMEEVRENFKALMEHPVFANHKT